MQFFSYTVGSAIGILPGTVLFVLLGTLASSITEVINGDLDTSPAVLFSTIAVSIVVMIIVVVLLTRYAKKALREQTEKAEAEQAAAAAAQGEAMPSEIGAATASEEGSTKNGNQSVVVDVAPAADAPAASS